MKMSFLSLLILSVIQGVTEFIPVSSSAHLIVIPFLLGWSPQGMDWDVALHLGTLGAVLVYFWESLWQSLKDCIFYASKKCFAKHYTDAVHRVILGGIATLPLIVSSLLFKNWRMDLDGNQTIQVIAGSSIVFGGLLFFSDRSSPFIKTLRDISFSQALWIGIAQCFALIPGASRSGLCLTAARFLKIDRSLAVEFSFFLSIPTILGAFILTSYEFSKGQHSLFTQDQVLALGFSFGIGLLVIRGMMTYIKGFSLLPFALYRVALGCFLLWFF